MRRPHIDGCDPRTVRDTVAPTLTLACLPTTSAAEPQTCSITATVVASDTCDANPTVQLVSITSSDPLDVDDVQAVGGGQVAFERTCAHSC